MLNGKGDTSLKEGLYDCAVIGLGCMGITSLYYIAKSIQDSNQSSTMRVIGIEQYSIPNAIGSSHGKSRMTRQAYYEGDEYTPLIKRTLDLIEELQNETNQRLFNLTGCLFMESTEDPTFIPKVEKAAKKYNLGYEMYDHESLLKKYTYLDFSSHKNKFYGLLEKKAGYINPDKTIKCYLDQINRKYNQFCDVKTNTKIESICKVNGIYQIKDSNGNVYKAKKIVLSGGPWNIDLLKQFKGWVDFETSYLKKHSQGTKPLSSFFRIQRNQVIFLRYKNPLNKTPKEVVYFSLKDDAHYAFYGVPEEEEGGYYKLGLHHYDCSFYTMKDYQKQDSKEFIQEVLSDGRRYFKDFDDMEIMDTSTCLYTIAPDMKYILDYMPGDKDAILVSVCSSHALKCMSAVGEIVSGIFNNKRKPLETFSLSRFNRVGKF